MLYVSGSNSSVRCNLGANEIEDRFFKTINQLLMLQKCSENGRKPL